VTSPAPYFELAILNARVITLAGVSPKCGSEMSQLGVIPCGHIGISSGRIVSITQGPVPSADQVIDAQGRVLMPGFVDCHTHACWAGDRLDEWAKRLRGVPYLDILTAGGGIMSTVRAVRDTHESELSETLLARIDEALRSGTTTIEVKSGYGLTVQAELKMLRAITNAAANASIRVVPTAMLGHAIDDQCPDFINTTISQTLPELTRAFPGIAVDAFCEKGAWSLEDCVSLFRAAGASGHPCRVHADQFNSLGMIERAASLGLTSVDHLEATPAENLDLLASTWRNGRRGVMGVGLPLCGLHMADGRFANLRRLIDAGGACAIATNCNPGSAPSISMPLAIAAAVRYCGLSPFEAITAATANAAHVLGLSDVGRIEPGCLADLILLDCKDERELSYYIGRNPTVLTIAGGKVAYQA